MTADLDLLTGYRAALDEIDWLRAELDKALAAGWIREREDGQ